MYLYIAVRKLRFLTHVQARYENKTFWKLMKASFQRIRNIFVFAMYLENCILNQYLEYMILRDNIKENINIQDIRGVTSQDVTKQ